MLSKPLGRNLWESKVVTIVAVTLVLFFLAELALRVGGVGWSTRFFLDGQDGYTVTNPRFGRLFYPEELLRGAYPSRFATHKAPGTKRIFVLGESAAAGYPDPAFSFPRVLESLLRTACPESSWEITNTGVTAMNSHAIRLIAAQSARYEPDAAIIYMGNNEVVGPYGPGSLLGGSAMPLPVIRAVTWLRSTRTGQALQSFADWILRSGRPDSWSGLDMFQNAKVAADDPALEGVYHNFESNLRDIMAAFRARGVPVILCTVASNVTECPPLGSGEINVAAIASYKQGVSLRSEGRILEAADSLRCARDADTLRFRADSRINAIIRQVASEENVPLIDAEQNFLQLQLSSAPDDAPLFFEHVHFTLEGNRELALACASALANLWQEQMPCLRPDFFSTVERDRIADDLGYSALAEGYSIGSIVVMLEKPPFAGQPGHTERIGWWNAKLRAIDEKLTDPYLAGAIHQLERAVGQRPRDGILWSWLARHYEDRKRWSEAETAYRRSLEVLPGNPAVLAQLGDLLWAQGRKTEAVRFFEKFLEIIPSHPGYRHKLLLGKISE
jgi:tetratricopeptide (TPR) repeat protein